MFTTTPIDPLPAGDAFPVGILTSLRAGEATPLHVHEHEESFRVLAGLLRVETERGGRTLAPGDALTVPAGVAHASWAVGDGVRYVSSAAVRSAARYEDFLRAAAPAGEWGEGDEERLAALGAANGIRVLGPPGTTPTTPPAAYAA